MQLLQAGSTLEHYGVGVATLTFTPINDRAAIVTNIIVNNPSAADNWTVTVSGREVGRYRVSALNHNNMLGGGTRSTTQYRNLFQYCRDILKQPLLYPVPNGQSITVASVGGATADIVIAYEEVTSTDVVQSIINHPTGNAFLMPLTAYLNAAQAAAGVISFDTFVMPNWIPNVFNGTALPAGWKITQLALFKQGLGVNTYSGAANHQSTTKSLRLTLNGQQMFTRDNLGLLDLGDASAAGSANSVYGTAAGRFQAFNDVMPTEKNMLDPALVLSQGDSALWQTELTGDLTGNAAYAEATLHILARIDLTGKAAT